MTTETLRQLSANMLGTILTWPPLNVLFSLFSLCCQLSNFLSSFVFIYTTAGSCMIRLRKTVPEVYHFGHRKKINPPSIYSQTLNTLKMLSFYHLVLL
jgi:hypothetical protein